MKILKICDRVIEYFFYLLFFLVPFAVSSQTSELFEFNKIWLTFAITLVIGASWATKMIVKKQFRIQRTVLDIPILLFLGSQIISTLVSWDIHVSLWGYYSRFNGGLLSIIAYIFLYYAFVSNMASFERVKKSLLVSLFSGLIVALWGLPSHFGYDPTCLVFRGTFDVSCWTTDFQPKVRIFSTLGQPDWLAAYLAILFPISIAFFVKSIKKNTKKWFNIGWKTLFFLFLTFLFYLDLTFTRSRSAVLATWVALVLFTGLAFFVSKKQFKGKSVLALIKKYWYLIVLLVVLKLTIFIVGQPFSQLERFTLPGIQTYITQNAEKVEKKDEPKQEENQPHFTEMGGTDSTKIRLIVWEGGLETFKHHPIFGTGVETYAFAYYKYKPAAQNLTSEWNFLYNKAHNEYVNFLATTGIVGLLTYLSVIAFFLWTAFKKIFRRSKKEPEINLFSLALLISYVTILITNFFGFSVVLVNVYFFLIPAFFFIIEDQLKSDKVLSLGKESKVDKVSNVQWGGIVIFNLIVLYLLYSLFVFWQADKAYAMGSNLNRAGQYQEAYGFLQQAISQRPGEPVFRDELALNTSVLSVIAISQDATGAAELSQKLAQDAIAISDNVVAGHPNNVVFRKTQTRVYYTLSQVNPEYLPKALVSLEKAYKLAPNDANIAYNLGVLYGQNAQNDKAIEVLTKTTQLKPNYRDAFYALGIFYHEAAIDDNENIVDQEKNKKAIEQMEYILEKIAPEDTAAKDAIKLWQ